MLISLLISFFLLSSLHDYFAWTNINEAHDYSIFPQPLLGPNSGLRIFSFSYWEISFPVLHISRFIPMYLVRVLQQLGVGFPLVP
jgi:hypothetical protein